MLDESRAIRRAQAILVIGDVFIFVFFAAAGRATHDIPLGSAPILTVLAVAAPFALPWFILAALLSVFHAERITDIQQTLFWTAIAWLSAGCIGLVARSMILQRPMLPMFAAAVLGINGALLLTWHLGMSVVAALWLRRGIRPHIRVFTSGEALSRAVVQELVQAAQAAIAERGQFRVALSGGETPQAIYRGLAQPPNQAQVDWSKVQIFWGDERCVPLDDMESNYYQAHMLLLDHVPLLPVNIHRIKGELEPAAAAHDYAQQLEAQAEGHRWPHLDLVLLGLGADGHTASLFPGSVAPSEAQSPVVAVTTQYQDRPAQRVTLTPMVFNSARHVMFLVTGESKAAAVAATIEGTRNASRWPAQRIHPSHGTVTWMLDQAAARDLKGI